MFQTGKPYSSKQLNTNILESNYSNRNKANLNTDLLKKRTNYCDNRTKLRFLNFQLKFA